MNTTKQFRFSLQAVVAKEARAYGFAVVVWSCGAFLIVERGKPTAGAVFIFVAGILVAQIASSLIAFGKPTRRWQSPNPIEYVWTTMHVLPIGAAVLVAWAIARSFHGEWAYGCAPGAAIFVYETLLAAESLILSAEPHVEPASPDMSADTSDSSL